jgi:ABC-type multidrug transport system ATPase subunit
MSASVAQRPAPLLECRDLSRFFGAFPALRRVNFELIAGRLVALFGSNGAGKSTLLRVIAGNLRPTSGTVHVNGINSTVAGARSLVGLLAHESLLHPTLTVRENLVHYAVLYGLPDAKAAAAAALERVGGERLADLRVGDLSQGMKQKAALARCILHHPRLLLLDEPFASLDRRTIAELRQTLLELRRDGVAMLVSTHTNELVTDIADGSLTLERGRLVELSGAVA